MPPIRTLYEDDRPAYMRSGFHNASGSLPYPQRTPNAFRTAFEVNPDPEEPRAHSGRLLGFYASSNQPRELNSRRSAEKLPVQTQQHITDRHSSVVAVVQVLGIQHQIKVESCRTLNTHNEYMPLLTSLPRVLLNIQSSESLQSVHKLSLGNSTRVICEQHLCWEVPLPTTAPRMLRSTRTCHTRLSTQLPHTSSIRLLRYIPLQNLQMVSGSDLRVQPQDDWEIQHSNTKT
jgi:hypothetical protein